ncbi:histidinol-phosphate transaminase [candidate division WOR-3 bacterium]|nr:histidinol-phosphate transaminase [candidate division WOR-3 bacterium]
MSEVRVLKTRASLDKIKPYKPGKLIEELVREYGFTGEIIKLASNENPLGTSPKALAALSHSLTEVHRYPDNSCYALRNRLSEIHETPADFITVGNGSVEIILQAALAYLDPKSEAVMSSTSFIMYPVAINIAGAKPVVVPIKDWGHDLEGILEAITEKTRIVFVDNPNNPLGSVITREEMDDFIGKVPDHVLVIVDEAYYEYVGNMDYPRSLHYVHEGHNVIVLRTFSKIYGLAGLRVGYGFAKPDIIKSVNKVRLPFSVSRPAQIAALAALEDEDHRDESRALNEAGKLFLTKEFEGMGLDYVPPFGNFVFVRFKGEANPIAHALERRGIIIRPVGGHPDALRVSIGSADQNRKLVTALKEILAGKEAKG